jgi:hypothetical protein
MLPCSLRRPSDLELFVGEGYNDFVDLKCFNNRLYYDLCQFK